MVAEIEEQTPQERFGLPDGVGSFRHDGFNRWSIHGDRSGT